MTDDEAHDIAMDCAWSASPTAEFKAALLKAVADEREQCAKVASGTRAGVDDPWDGACEVIESKIRARGEQSVMSVSDSPT